jgi:hypothetical protein
MITLSSILRVGGVDPTGFIGELVQDLPLDNGRVQDCELGSIEIFQKAG